MARSVIECWQTSSWSTVQPRALNAVSSFGMQPERGLTRARSRCLKRTTMPRRARTVVALLCVSCLPCLPADAPQHYSPLPGFCHWGAYTEGVDYTKVFSQKRSSVSNCTKACGAHSNCTGFEFSFLSRGAHGGAASVCCLWFNECSGPSSKNWTSSAQFSPQRGALTVKYSTYVRTKKPFRRLDGACLWSSYRRDEDFVPPPANKSTAPTTVAKCMTECDATANCTGFEFPHSAAYCSFWLNGACPGPSSKLSAGWIPDYFSRSNTITYVTSRSRQNEKQGEQSYYRPGIHGEMRCTCADFAGRRDSTCC